MGRSWLGLLQIWIDRVIDQICEKRLARNLGPLCNTPIQIPAHDRLGCSDRHQNYIDNSSNPLRFQFARNHAESQRFVISC